MLDRSTSSIAKLTAYAISLHVAPLAQAKIPTRRKLEQLTGLHERTISNALGELRSAGYLDGHYVSMPNTQPESAIVRSNGHRTLSRSEILGDLHVSRLKPVLAQGKGHSLHELVKRIYTDAWQDALVDPDAEPIEVASRIVNRYIQEVTDEEPNWGWTKRLVKEFGLLTIEGFKAAMMVGLSGDKMYRYARATCDGKNRERKVAEEMGE